MNNYYYVENENKIGPLSKSDLKGKLSKDTLIWREGMENWVEASKLPELNDLFQKEPPPIPCSVTESNKEIGGVKRNALLLFGFTIALGIMEYFEWENNKFYGFMITATVITTYYVLKNIKKYLNNVLNYTATNINLNVLIATSIILGIAFKLTYRYEERIIAISQENNIFMVIILALFATILLNLFYFFKLGKKLSKIENEVASKFSKFAYATVISFVVIVFLSFVSEDNSTAFIIVDTIVTAGPLLYLIVGVENSEKQVRFI